MGEGRGSEVSSVLTTVILMGGLEPTNHEITTGAKASSPNSTVNSYQNPIGILRNSLEIMRNLPFAVICLPSRTIFFKREHTHTSREGVEREGERESQAGSAVNVQPMRVG